MVPMLTCGLVRSNFAFATGVLLWPDHSFSPGTPIRRSGLCRLLVHVRPSTGRTCLNASGASGLSDDLLRHVRGNLGVGVEQHAVASPAGSLRPQVADVAEHLRQRNQSLDDAGAGALLH